MVVRRRWPDWAVLVRRPPLMRLRSVAGLRATPECCGPEPLKRPSPARAGRLRRPVVPCLLALGRLEAVLCMREAFERPPVVLMRLMLEALERELPIEDLEPRRRLSVDGLRATPEC